ncbi:MAG: heptosyltransferase [Acidobacteriota bacterium]|jgi:lipopolysaccharide heptosyltransferase I
MNVLIVRLGALGDIVHAVPAVAALRAAAPDARIDWLVDRKHRTIVDLVTSIDRTIVLERPTPAGWIETLRTLREGRYDWALDFQGLLKSAVLARASGAARVAGFSIWHLREKTARVFYTDLAPARRAEAGLPANAGHVIRQNLRLLRALGIDDDRITFPLAPVDSAVVATVRATVGGDGSFALINPGAAWPNKRWPPERFGEVAAFLRDVRQLPSVVLWGPGENALAQAVVDASAGAARLCPATNVTDILALCRSAALMVSGDTGPLHIASAAGTPTVSIFGPTDPERNGPWAAADVTVSRFASCRCHYRRRCHERAWCLADLPVTEVTAAAAQRLRS